MRTLSCTAGILLGALAIAPAGAAATDETKRVRFPERLRGVTLSTHGDGRDWAEADLIRPTMEEIKRVGGDWVAIHPYASVSADGGVRFPSMHTEEGTAYITRPIEVAHALGLKILIAPHLAYWGSPFSWRGEIEFKDEPSLERFWADYERWIVALAELAADADGFVVGSELDRTLDHEARWRRIVAEVRARTRAPLTYAANWTDYERVGFWDALDAIGIQAYFPVAESERADEATIRQAWATLMPRLSAFSAKHKRPIVFTELGYTHSFAAAVRPWDPKSDGEEAVPQQEICLRVALEAVEAEPAVNGAFLWKWFPEPRPVGRNFRLATPGIKALIRQVWTQRPAGVALTSE